MTYKPWTDRETSYATEKDSGGRYVRTAVQAAADLGRSVGSINGIRQTPTKPKRVASDTAGRRAVLADKDWTPAQRETIRACMLGTATRDQWMNHPYLSGPSSYRGQVQRMVLDRLLDHQASGQLPTSGRFLLYELEQAGKIGKPVKGQSRYASMSMGETPREANLSAALGSLRNWDIIPWEWIVDETRQIDEWRHASTVLEYVRDSIREARINPWPGEPPLLLCESRSLSGVLANVAAEFVCPISSSNGQAAGFLRTEVAPVLLDNDREVLYLGDFDLIGMDIEANSRRVLEDETGRGVEWERIALTQKQIKDQQLQDLFIEKSDNRFDPPRKSKAWETEALGQGLIIDLVRAKLTEKLLPTRLEDVREREQVQRQRVRELLADLDDPAGDDEDEDEE